VSQTDRPGESRLRAALRRRRQSAEERHAETRPPISLQRETPLEALILERINQLQEEVQALQDQQKWLGRLIGGTVVTALLNLVIR
jgi:hypothetical protein